MWKKETDITFERKEMESRFKRLIPHFRPCPAQIWHWRHSPTSAGIQNSKWWPPKPEAEVTFEPKLISRFQRQPRHFRPRSTQIWHCRHGPTSADTPNSKYQPQTGSDFEFSMSANVGPCRQCHVWIGHGLKYMDSRLNRLESFFRSKVISTFGFYGRHCGFPMSDDIGLCRQCHIWGGHVRKWR
jgi:hypothetical protein